MKPLATIAVLFIIALSTGAGGVDGRELDARRLLGSGRFDEAFERIRAVVERSPDRSRFYGLFAEAAQYSGRSHEADSILSVCVWKGWAVGDAVAAMAWLDVRRARWLDAYTHFQASLEYPGNRFRAYAGIQEMHEKLHGSDAAISHLLALTHAHDRSGPVWYALALAYWGQWDLAKALNAAEQALRGESPDTRVRYLHLAIRCAITPAVARQGQVERAYREAQSQGDWEGVAFLQWVRMHACIAEARMDSADVYCTEGLRIASDLGMYAWKGQYLLQSGRIALGRGDLRHAIASVDSAALTFRLAGSHDGVLSAYSLRMNLLLESFQYAEALNYCSRGLLELSDRADSRLHAGAAIDAAWILSRIGGQRIALVLGIHAESVLEGMLYASHDRCRLNAALASIHASLGDTGLAMRYGRTALHFARSPEGNEELLSNCEGVLGEVEWKRGNIRAARVHFGRQWTLARRTGNPGEEAAAALALGRLCDLSGEATAAGRWAAIALQHAVRAGDRYSEKEIRTLRASIAAQRHDSTRVREELVRACACLDAIRRLRFLCSLTREMREWYLEEHASVAEGLIAVGDVRAAAWLLSRARADVSPWSVPDFNLPASAPRSELEQLETDRRATSALIHRWVLKGFLEDASYSGQAVSALCLFFSSSVPAFLRIDDSVHRSGTDGSMRESLGNAAVSALDPEEVAVDFLIRERRTQVIILTRDTIASCVLPAGRTAFAALGREIQDGQGDGAAGSGRTWGPGRTFLPLVQLLQKTGGRRARLAIIGDGPQAAIPFEALEIAGGAVTRPLMDRFRVSYRSTLIAGQGNVLRRETHNGRVLVVGDPLLSVNGNIPTGDPGPPEGETHGSAIIRSLPGSIDDMHVLVECFGSRVDVLRGAEATDARFCSTAPGYWLVHLATHGTARTSEQKAHVLYLSPSQGSGGEVGFDDVLGMRMTGAMVVLPACHAGQSSRTGDLESMAHAFLEAGAGSVLAARWAVRDELATEFLACFYHGLSRGESREAALQSTMREMMARGHHSYRVWASFQLMGNGGSMPETAAAMATGSDGRWMTVAGGAAMLLIAVGYGWTRWRVRTPSHREGERSE